MFARVTAFIQEKTKLSFRLRLSCTSIQKNVLTAVLAFRCAPYPQSFPWRTFQMSGKASRRRMQLGTRRGKANLPDQRRNSWLSMALTEKKENPSNAVFFDTVV